MRHVEFTEDAQDELDHVFADTQFKYGDLGLRRFVNDLHHKLSLASENPMLFQASRASKTIRRIVMRQPYKILYVWDADKILVIAIIASRANSDT